MGTPGWLKYANNFERILGMHMTSMFIRLAALAACAGAVGKKYLLTKAQTRGLCRCGAQHNLKGALKELSTC